MWILKCEGELVSQLHCKVISFFLILIRYNRHITEFEVTTVSLMTTNDKLYSWTCARPGQVSSGRHRTSATPCWSCHIWAALWAFRWSCPAKGRRRCPPSSLSSLLASWHPGTPAYAEPGWTFSYQGDHTPGDVFHPDILFSACDVDITLCVHRFRMHSRFNLRSVLPATGISDAFNPTAADFSGISG